MKRHSKTTVFTALTLVLSVALVELGGHTFYRLKHGSFLWQDSPRRFNIRPFTEFTPDERGVTNRKNFIAQTENGKWVALDENRFRKGPNQYFHDKDNIVFLGDSVPFGWNAGDADTVPAKFYRLMKAKTSWNYGVLNAAVPSYSLYQAIERYHREIEGVYPVKYLVLQVYDPVSQFIIWGNRWDEKINWTWANTRAGHQRQLAHDFLFQYSSLYHVLSRRFWPLSAPPTVQLDLKDQAAFARFKNQNTRALQKFLSSLQRHNTRLILLPANSAIHDPLHAVETLWPAEKVKRVAMETFNDSLKEFAAQNPGAYYFDVASYFDGIAQAGNHGKKGLFLDSCCHLSPDGAEKQAQFILDNLRAIAD